MSNVVFRSEFDRKIFEEANAVLAANGLTVVDAVDRMLSYIAQRKRLPPFDLSGLENDDIDAIASGLPDYASLNFKELLAACPLDGIELDTTRDLPRDIDI